MLLIAAAAQRVYELAYCIRAVSVMDLTSRNPFRGCLPATGQLRLSGVVAALGVLRFRARTAVYYKSGSQDPLEVLVEQSLELPVVQLPATTAGAAAAAGPHVGRPAHGPAGSSNTDDPSDLLRHQLTVPGQSSAPKHVLLPDQQEQKQSSSSSIPSSRSSSNNLPQRKLRPCRMDFELMFGQLVQWKAQHLSAHVPRFCFDAPELGAWVRYVRKQHKDGLLEQWKVERLNSLQFEWELSDQEARWHHLYHQLRRYRLLYGSSEVDCSRSGDDEGDWSAVAWWLNKQGRLLAKQKLSGQNVAMLQLLEVTLRLPKRLVHRTAQLQAMNGPERRKLRKKWKKLDAAAAAQRHHQRRQQWQQQREVERQQQLVASRRLELLSSVQGRSQLQEPTQFLLLQQQRQLQQQQSVPDLQRQQQFVSDLQSQQQPVPKVQRQQQSVLDLQRQQRRLPVAVDAAQEAVVEPGGQQPSKHNVQQVLQPAATTPPQQQRQQHPQLQAQQVVEQAMAPQQPGELPVLQQQQQQQQQHDTVFYQRNWRGKRARQITRQEKWLHIQQQEQEDVQGFDQQ